MNLKEKTLLLLRKYDIKPNPELDQFFLVDEDAIEKVVSAAELKKTDVVLEIGAGLGALTSELAKRAKKVIAIEIDEKLANVLRKEFAGSNVEVCEGNALNLFPKYRGSADKVVGSIPYSISEPLLRMFFYRICKPAVLVVSKPFAERILSTNSLLGIYSRAFLDIEVVEEVGKDAFYPQPKVKSVIIKVSKKEVTKESDFESWVVQKLFFQEGKKAKNAVESILCELGLSKRLAREKVKEAGLDKDELVRHLKIAQFRKILQTLSAYGDSKV